MGKREQAGSLGYSGCGLTPLSCHHSSTSAFAGLFIIKKEQDIIDIQHDINFSVQHTDIFVYISK